MGKGKVAVGPMRDCLAKLSEAEKGDDWLTAHELKDRTGVSYAIAEARLERLRGLGWAQRRVYAGVRGYRITTKGSDLL